MLKPHRHNGEKMFYVCPLAGSFS